MYAPSHYPIKHAIFVVPGGRAWDNLADAIAEARSIGVPIGFIPEGEQGIELLLQERPVQTFNRANKTSGGVRRRRR